MTGSTILRSRRPLSYWLLCDRSGVHEVFLTFGGVDFGGEGKTLPVFSTERNVQDFLDSSIFDESIWRLRRTSGGEMISLLYGPCGSIERIAMDPGYVAGLGETAASRETLSPASFVDVLLGRNERCHEHGGSLPAGGPQVALRTP